MKVHWGKVGRWIGPSAGPFVIIKPHPSIAGEFLILGGETSLSKERIMFDKPVCTSALDENSSGRAVEILRRAYIWHVGRHPEWNYRVCIDAKL